MADLEAALLAIESEIPHLDKHYPGRGLGATIVALRALSQQLYICCFTVSEAQTLPMFRRAGGVILRWMKDSGQALSVRPHGSKMPLTDWVVQFDGCTRRAADCFAQGGGGDAMQYVLVAYGIILAILREHGAPLANRPI